MSTSPTEAGELPPSPHAPDVEPPLISRMDTIEDDSLQIQPPQTHVKKEKPRKHKHKRNKAHKRDSSREGKTSDRGEQQREKRREKQKEEHYTRDDKSERPAARHDGRMPHRDDRAPVKDDRALVRDDKGPGRTDRGFYREDRVLPARDDRDRQRDRQRDDRYRQPSQNFTRPDARPDIRPLMPSHDLRENLSRGGNRDIDRTLRVDNRRYSPVEKDDRRRAPDEVGGGRRRGGDAGERHAHTRHRSRSPIDRPRDRAEKSTRHETSDSDIKSGMKKSASKSELSRHFDKNAELVVLSGGEESEEEEEEEAESGSGEGEEESGSGEEEEASSSGEEEEEEEESGSAVSASGSEEGSEEEEEGSEEEVEEEGAESSATASLSEHDSDHKTKDSSYKREKNGTQESRNHKSKFESESESEAEEPIQQSRSHTANGDNSESEVEMALTPEMSDPPTPPPKLPPYYPALQGCRSVDDFRHLNRIEEGTYGVVFRAEDLKQKEIVALKRLKMEKEKEGFPITSLREINTLLKTQHENIVTVREIVVGSNMDKIYVVMDFVEHDLKALMESMKSPFAIGEVKTLLLQLLKAVAHMHDNWILHRDLKTSNLLLSHKGILKVGDFGLAREYGSPLRNYTPVVVTLWYRAPELLLGCKQYSTAIDMWSVGCIFAELLLMKALWPGKNEIDELNKIFKDMGTPNEKIWPGVSELPAMKKCNFVEYPYNTLKNRFAPGLLDESGYDLLNKFLTYDPKKRISAEDAKPHEYFDSHPLPVDPSLFPTWPARSEQPRGKRDKTPKPPSGGQAYKLLNADDGAGFHLGAHNQASGFNLKF